MGFETSQKGFYNKIASEFIATFNSLELRPNMPNELAFCKKQSDFKTEECFRYYNESKLFCRVVGAM